MKVKNFNNRFKVSRINAGYTQRDVNEILGFLSFQALSHYEHETAIPSNKVLYTLPNLYNVSLDYLLCLDDYRSHQEFLLTKLRLSDETIELLKQANSQNPIRILEIKKTLIEWRDNYGNTRIDG